MEEKKDVQDVSSSVTGLIIELFLNLLWMKTAFKYCLLTLFIEMYVQLLGHFQKKKIRKTDSFEFGKFRSVIKDVVKCLKPDIATHAFLKGLVTRKGIQHLHKIIPPDGNQIVFNPYEWGLQSFHDYPL